MDALEALLTRRSIGQLVEPAPDDEALATMMRAGMRAADHGRLQPWRFIILRGAAREKLGEVMVEAARRHDPEAPSGLLKREREKPMRGLRRPRQDRAGLEARRRHRRLSLYRHTRLAAGADQRAGPQRLRPLLAIKTQNLCFYFFIDNDICVFIMMVDLMIWGPRNLRGSLRRVTNR
jgi:nitroreductase